jgi:hypothetical protein
MKIVVLVATLLVMSTAGAGAPLGAPFEPDEPLVAGTIGGTLQKVPALTQDWYETYSVAFTEAMSSFPAAPWITNGLDPEEIVRIEAGSVDMAGVRVPESGTLPMIFAGCLVFLGIAKIWRPAAENQRRFRHKVRREKRMMAC